MPFDSEFGQLGRGSGCSHARPQGSQAAQGRGAAARRSRDCRDVAAVCWSMSQALLLPIVGTVCSLQQVVVAFLCASPDPDAWLPLLGLACGGAEHHTIHLARSTQQHSTCQFRKTNVRYLNCKLQLQSQYVILDAVRPTASWPAAGRAGRRVAGRCPLAELAQLASAAADNTCGARPPGAAR